jgi:hypothetical protein
LACIHSDAALATWLEVRVKLVEPTVPFGPITSIGSLAVNRLAAMLE